MDERPVCVPSSPAPGALPPLTSRSAARWQDLSPPGSHTPHGASNGFVAAPSASRSPIRRASGFRPDANQEVLPATPDALSTRTRSHHRLPLHPLTIAEPAADAIPTVLPPHVFEDIVNADQRIAIAALRSVAPFVMGAHTWTDRQFRALLRNLLICLGRHGVSPAVWRFVLNIIRALLTLDPLTLQRPSLAVPGALVRDDGGPEWSRQMRELICKSVDIDNPQSAVQGLGEHSSALSRDSYDVVDTRTALFETLGRYAERFLAGSAKAADRADGEVCGALDACYGFMHSLSISSDERRRLDSLLRRAEHDDAQVAAASTLLVDSSLASCRDMAGDVLMGSPQQGHSISPSSKHEKPESVLPTFRIASAKSRPGSWSSSVGPRRQHHPSSRVEDAAELHGSVTTDVVAVSLSSSRRASASPTRAAAIASATTATADLTTKLDAESMDAEGFIIEDTDTDGALSQDVDYRLSTLHAESPRCAAATLRRKQPSASSSLMQPRHGLPGGAAAKAWASPPQNDTLHERPHSEFPRRSSTCSAAHTSDRAGPQPPLPASIRHEELQRVARRAGAAVLPFHMLELGRPTLPPVAGLRITTTLSRPGTSAGGSQHVLPHQPPAADHHPKPTLAWLMQQTRPCTGDNVSEVRAKRPPRSRTQLGTSMSMPTVHSRQAGPTVQVSKPTDASHSTSALQASGAEPVRKRGALQRAAQAYGLPTSSKDGEAMAVVASVSRSNLVIPGYWNGRVVAGVALARAGLRSKSSTRQPDSEVRVPVFHGTPGICTGEEAVWVGPAASNEYARHAPPTGAGPDALAPRARQLPKLRPELERPHSSAVATHANAPTMRPATAMANSALRQAGHRSKPVDASLQHSWTLHGSVPSILSPEAFEPVPFRDDVAGSDSFPAAPRQSDTGLREQAAAIRIQASLRGHQARKRYHVRATSAKSGARAPRSSVRSQQTAESTVYADDFGEGDGTETAALPEGQNSAAIVGDTNSTAAYPDTRRRSVASTDSYPASFTQDDRNEEHAVSDAANQDLPAQTSTKEEEGYAEDFDEDCDDQTMAEVASEVNRAQHGNASQHTATALIPETRAPPVETAATTIQAAFRGHRARQQVSQTRKRPEALAAFPVVDVSGPSLFCTSHDEERDACVSARRATSRPNSTDAVQRADRENAAATRIQATARGYVLRKTLAQTRANDRQNERGSDAANPTVMCSVGTEQTPKESAARHRAATCIQAGYRSHSVRRAATRVGSGRELDLHADPAAPSSTTAPMPSARGTAEVAPPRMQSRADDGATFSDPCVDCDSGGASDATHHEIQRQAAVRIQAQVRGRQSRRREHATGHSALSSGAPAAMDALPARCDAKDAEDARTDALDRCSQSAIDPDRDAATTDTSDATSMVAAHPACADQHANTAMRDPVVDLNIATARIQATYRGHQVRGEFRTAARTERSAQHQTLAEHDSEHPAPENGGAVVTESTPQAEVAGTSVQSSAEQSNGVSGVEHGCSVAQRVAVVRIQASVRGHQARRLLAMTRPAAANVTSQGRPAMDDTCAEDQNSEALRNTTTAESKDAFVDDDAASLEESNKAATRVQAGVRGHLVRLHMRQARNTAGANADASASGERYDGTMDAQRAESDFVAPGHHRDGDLTTGPTVGVAEPRHYAAVRIQESFRGHRVRQRARAQRTHWHEPLDGAKETDVAASEAGDVGAVSHTFEILPSDPTASRNAALQHNAATKIQAHMRGHLARRQFTVVGTRPADPVPACIVPVGPQQESGNSVEQAEHARDAAVRIQAGVRGHLIRNRMKQARPAHASPNQVESSVVSTPVAGSLPAASPSQRSASEQAAAAVRIQATFRGHQSRHRVSRRATANIAVGVAHSEMCGGDDAERIFEAGAKCDADHDSFAALKHEDTTRSPSAHESNAPAGLVDAGIQSRETQAATLIQAVMRGHLTRKQQTEVAASRGAEQTAVLSHASALLTPTASDEGAAAADRVPQDASNSSSPVASADAATNAEDVKERSAIRIQAVVRGHRTRQHGLRASPADSRGASGSEAVQNGPPTDVRPKPMVKATAALQPASVATSIEASDASCSAVNTNAAASPATPPAPEHALEQDLSQRALGLGYTESEDYPDDFEEYDEALQVRRASAARMRKSMLSTSSAAVGAAMPVTAGDKGGHGLSSAAPPAGSPRSIATNLNMHATPA